MTGRFGCFPGTFDPPTIAHLAVAEAAIAAAGLDRLDLLLSRHPLGKPGASGSVEARAQSLADRLGNRARLAVAVRDERLIVDLAEGYDAVVLGADKWRQVLDPAWYGDDLAARDRLLARLPLVLVAPRAGDDLADLADRQSPSGDETQHPVRRLDVDPRLRPVSSSAVRGRRPEAAGWAVGPSTPPTDPGP